MGTRSITVVKDEQGNKIIEMYRQMDGYPTGMGQDLLDFVSQFTVVNGISLAEDRKIANGMACFAAQLVAYFKDGAGGYYLHAPATDFKSKKQYYKAYYAEYYYEITQEGEHMKVRCWDTWTGSEIQTDPYGKKFMEQDDG